MNNLEGYVTGGNIDDFLVDQNQEGEWVDALAGYAARAFNINLL